MTEQQLKSKFTLMKILSMVCLVVVIASGFLPWVTIQGDLRAGTLGELSAMTESMTDEELEMAQTMLDEQDVDFDLEGFMNSMKHFIDPIEDGTIAPMDFLALSTNFNTLKSYLEQASELGGDFAFEMDSETQEILTGFSAILMAPVVVFGVLALAATVRLILRVFNRRGLGVFVCILTAFNAVFMFLVGALLSTMVGSMQTMATLTVVPPIAFICSITGCIFWGQARKLNSFVVVEQQPQQPQAQIPVPQNVEE